MNRIIRTICLLAAAAVLLTGCSSPDAPKGVTMADRQSLANRPLFYKVRCNTGNSEASFLVDARSGKILNTAVRPQKTFLAKLF